MKLQHLWLAEDEPKMVHWMAEPQHQGWATHFLWSPTMAAVIKRRVADILAHDERRAAVIERIEIRAAVVVLLAICENQEDDMVLDCC